MVTVEDLAVEPQILAVEQNAQLHGWQFERLAPRRFLVTLSAGNGDLYLIEVECEGFPLQPAAFHWRNRQTGCLDDLADAPKPYGYFHGTGRICAPWNRLASAPGGPHTDWEQANWKEQPETKATVTLAAMVLRVYRELRSKHYDGRGQ